MMIEEITDRLVKWIKSKDAPPFTLDIRPTEKCNLKCLSCPLPKKKKKDFPKEIPYEKYIEIINDAADLGVKRVEIVGGGEPLVIGKHTLNMMLEIKKRNMIGTITTNATLFNEEMVKELVNAEWDLIAISLDGPDAETQDYLRGVKGTFDKIIKNIKLFNKWKKKMGKTFPEIIFIPVVSNKNCKKVKDMVILAKNLEVKKLEFKPLTLVYTQESKKLQLTDDDMKHFRKIAKEAIIYANQYDIITNLDSFICEDVNKISKNIVKVIKKDIIKKESKANLICFLPFFYIAISNNGSVEPCVVRQDKIIEDITQKKLKFIWEGDYFNSFREKILEGKFPKQCKGCCGGMLFENRKIRKRLLEKLK